MSAMAEKKPGTLVLAIGGRPKGESYGASKESDAEASDESKPGDSGSYESEGQAMIDAINKGDANGVGAAMAKIAMRCMADD